MAIGLNHNTEIIRPNEDSFLEIGSVYGSARSATPTGYLLCDGSLVSRTTYSRLFNVISTTYGVGNGSTTFALPDLRGSFIRGAGTSSGYTQNITVTLGTKTNDAIQGHRHSDSGHIHSFQAGLITGFGSDVRNTDGVGNVTWGVQTQTSTGYANIADPTTDTVNGTPRTTTETIVKNLGMNFFIKF
jgi:microcystin-dependent protein